MSNKDTQIALDYAEAVFQRATRPLLPNDFAPNWDDRPSRYKIYHEAERFWLPTDLPAHLLPIGDIFTRMRQAPVEGKALAFEELATVLQLAHGVLGRRLDINWNKDAQARERATHALYARGAASGGGLYPTEIYWICGESSPLLPGIYHYDNAHHTLARLLTGNVIPQVQAALFNHPAARVTDQFLCISVNFWKNAFKYHNFCYHVVTEDTGALLGALRMAAIGCGSDLQYLSWYHDEALNNILGLNTLTESVLAVIPLPQAKSTMPLPNPARPAQAAHGAAVSDISSFQRSKKVLRIPMVEQVHLSTLLTDEPRPAAQNALNAGYSLDASPVTGTKLDMLPQTRLQRDVIDIFKQRHSSFGRFSNQKPLAEAELGTLLSLAASVRNYSCDLKLPDGTPYFTRLMVFINHVQGIAPGTYAYDDQQQRLQNIYSGDIALFLQKNYYLQNYNMDQVSAVMVIVGKVKPMLEVYGNRGYRLLNAEVGMVAQGIYMAAAAITCSCGAVLGFDNIQLNKILGLEGSDESVVLALLLGNARSHQAGFNVQLV